MSENMKLWDRVKKTDPHYTKLVDYGKQKYTAIDPTWQLQKATEMWGPYGHRWGLKDLKFTLLDDGAAKVLMLEAEFFCPAEMSTGEECRFPVAVDLKFKSSDDTAKKLVTSARSKALSYLGFSADVFMGKFEDNQYVQMSKALFADRNAFMQKAAGKIKLAKTVEQLNEVRSKIEQMAGDDTITPEEAADLLQAADDHQASLNYLS